MEKQIIATFPDNDTAYLAIRNLKEKFPIVDAQVINRTENEANPDSSFPSMQITQAIYVGNLNASVPNYDAQNLGKIDDCDVCAEVYTQEGYEKQATEFLKQCGAYDVTIS